jgi:hypothetical protein
MSQAASYHGWRRLRGRTLDWQRVAAAEAASMGECYSRLLQATELFSSCSQWTWEYLVLPAGVEPAVYDAPRYYRQRMLRPWRGPTL